MRPLLEAWELGSGQPPPSQMLLLLMAAAPTVGADELLRLTPGQCDARLLNLREQWFGPKLEALADCPHCGETVEAAIDLRSLRQAATEPPTDGPVRARLPTCEDLIAVAAAPDVQTGRRWLLTRCLEDDQEISDDVVDAISARMAESDPQAAVEIGLECPDCGREWSLPFEVGSILWQEVSAWAVDTFRDVSVLAAAYGWSESDILDLSPARRQLYLEMVAG
jgi:hypothetical protein